MKNYTIGELYAGAWDNAIEQTAGAVKKLHGREYTRADWVVLEAYAEVYRLEFDIDGYIVPAEVRQGAV